MPPVVLDLPPALLPLLFAAVLLHAVLADVVGGGFRWFGLAIAVAVTVAPWCGFVACGIAVAWGAAIGIGGGWAAAAACGGAILAAACRAARGFIVGGAWSGRA